MKDGVCIGFNISIKNLNYYFVIVKFFNIMEVEVFTDEITDSQFLEHEYM